MLSFPHDNSTSALIYFWIYLGIYCTIRWAGRGQAFVYGIAVSYFHGKRSASFEDVQALPVNFKGRIDHAALDKGNDANPQE